MSSRVYVPVGVASPLRASVYCPWVSTAVPIREENPAASSSLLLLLFPRIAASPEPGRSRLTTHSVTGRGGGLELARLQQAKSSESE